MALQKIYTRTGDKGLTGLTDGSRVAKNSVRIEAYGTLDELNALLGVSLQHVSELTEKENEVFSTWVKAIQNDLFNLGSDLATPISARWEKMFIIDAKEIEVLEKLIDRCQSEIPVLREFVLPGGTLLNSTLHVCRTVCRRAERAAVTLSGVEEINPFAVMFLNRLSDYLFVLSRWVQVKAKKPEVTWKKDGGLRNLNVN